ncbi:MAG: hypothetical protein RIS86_34 [Planctomycetota bacterium]
MPAIPYAATTVAELLVSTADGATLAQRRLDPVRGYWIGRDPSCDVQVNDATVSRRHAFIFQANGRWMACDAGSTDGLATEAGPVRAAPLSAEGWVRVGSVYLWLSGGAPNPPDWIDARPTVAADGTASAVKLATEAFGEIPEDGLPSLERLLVVSDRSGAVHLAIDLRRLATSRGGGAPRITIGRSNAVDLQLCHRSVDPLHAVLAIGSEKCSLIDAGSSTGIVFDGKRWFRKRLERGVTLPVGDFRLTVLPIARALPPEPPAISAGGADGAPRRPSAFLDPARDQPPPPPPPPPGGISMRDDDEDDLRV